MTSTFTYIYFDARWLLK